MSRIVKVSGLAMMALLFTACGGQVNTVKKDEAAGALKAAPETQDDSSTASAKQPCDAPKSETAKESATEKKPCDSKAASAEKKSGDTTNDKASDEPGAEAAKKPCCASKKTAAAPEAPKK